MTHTTCYLFLQWPSSSNQLKLKTIIWITFIYLWKVLNCRYLMWNAQNIKVCAKLSHLSNYDNISCTSFLLINVGCNIIVSSTLVHLVVNPRSKSGWKISTIDFPNVSTLVKLGFLFKLGAVQKPCDSVLSLLRHPLIIIKTSLGTIVFSLKTHC